MAKVNDSGPLSAPAVRVIAIAYEWVLVPIDFHDYDLILNVGCSDSAVHPAPRVVTYRATLPGRRNHHAQSDVAGNLGLIVPVSDDSAEKRAAASERLIADAIIWELSKIKFGNEKTSLLIQGPMLPKLRGRLLYRGIPPHIAIWAVTWQPEWFWRLEASQQMLRNIDYLPGDGQGIVSAMYPPEGIDRASRSWVCKRAEKAVYHFEVLINTWDAVGATRFEKRGETEIPSFVGDLPSSSNGAPYLPAAMRSASEAVNEQSELERGFLWLLPLLRETNYDPCICVSKEPKLEKVIAFLDPQYSGADLFAGTSQVDWRDETALYEAFKMNREHMLTLLRGAGLRA